MLLINGVFGFDRQVHGAGFAVYVGDDSSYFVAHFEHGAGIFHAVAADFAGAQVASDFFAQIDFSAFGINSFHFASYALAFVVDRNKGGEGVGVKLFDAQADALALYVYAQNDGFNFLAFFVVAHNSFA